MRYCGRKPELRLGGSWQSKGEGADGAPFSVQGEFLEIDPPHEPILTWSCDWGDKHRKKLTHRFQLTLEGTKLTIRDEGFKDRPEACDSHSEDWNLVLTWPTQFFAHER